MIVGLRPFLERSPGSALVEVVSAEGSTPREAGAIMLVSPDAAIGTIGGGQLEFMAIARAREMLAGHAGEFRMDVPLGPEIGQCCGGRVALRVRPVDAELAHTLIERSERAEALLPQILVFGGGHVGHALASALALLPARTTIVETRPDALEGMPLGVTTRLTAMPEEMVRNAAPGSAFVVLTHDHALDFFIVAEALRRSDAAYVGMIGSKTKKATFRSWFFKTAGGSADEFARLVSPIGGDAVKDKRPAVIAALAAAEIIAAVVARAPAPAAGKSEVPA